MTTGENERLERDLREYGWERAQAKLAEPAKVELNDAVQAWLDGRLDLTKAAAAVRAVMPVDPSSVPLDARNARVVDGKLFRRSGKQWVTSDGSTLTPQ